MDTFPRSFFVRCLTIRVPLALAAGGIGFMAELIKLDIGPNRWP